MRSTSTLDGLLAVIAPMSSGAPPATGWAALDTVPGVKWEGAAKVVKQELVRSGTVVAGELSGANVWVKGANEFPASVNIWVATDVGGTDIDMASHLSRQTRVLRLAQDCRERTGSTEILYELTPPGRRAAFLYEEDPEPPMNGAQFAYQQANGVQIGLTLLSARPTSAQGQGPCAVDRAAKPAPGTWKPPPAAKSPGSTAGAAAPGAKAK